MFLGHLREVVRRNIEVNVELFNVEEKDARRKKEVRQVEGWVIKKTAEYFCRTPNGPQTSNDSEI